MLINWLLIKLLIAELNTDWLLICYQLPTWMKMSGWLTTYLATNSLISDSITNSLLITELNTSLVAEYWIEYWLIDY